MKLTTALPWQKEGKGKNHAPVERKGNLASLIKMEEKKSPR
jgi:hypothetical protein